MSVFFRGSTRRAVGIVVGLYAVFSLAWIFFSDAALVHLAADAAQMTRWQNYKGWAFVIFSSLLLAGLMRQVLEERDRVARQLARANRSLTMINLCRAALMRASHETELLGEICRLVVRSGGYRMAWVGLAEHDEARRVRPVAQAGFDEGYLEGVHIVWADTEHGRGPTGTAIRTGEPVVARNIPGDPAYGPWREAAIRRGYISSVAVPLPPDDGERCSAGALCLYAEEADAFDEAEIALLKGLASDLAFGLKALRERRARLEAEETVRRSEREFRLLFDHNPLPIWVFDIETLRFLAVNKAAVEHYGYSREEFLGMTIKDIRPKEDVPAMLQTVGRQPRGFDYAGIWRHQKKDGTVILVDITSHEIEFQGRPAEIVLANDVTARCAAEAALRELAERLEAVREEERTRIAREVHDVLGQLLTGLKMDLAWLDRRRAGIVDEALREAVGDRLREATKLADALIESVQHISSELRPSVLDNLGLAAAIQFESARFARRSGIRCELDAMPESLPLPPEAATGAFRIFQEILTNVARHAGAQVVRIRLEAQGARAVLEVRDDGRGITRAQQDDPHALGLLGMRERARRMRAALTIQGESGRGTTVRLEIPLEAKA